jgi:hypothetical protein
VVVEASVPEAALVLALAMAVAVALGSDLEEVKVAALVLEEVLVPVEGSAMAVALEVGLVAGKVGA